MFVIILFIQSGTLTNGTERRQNTGEFDLLL